MTRFSHSIFAAVLVLAALTVAHGKNVPKGKQAENASELQFHSARDQAKEFIGYYHSIPLTAEQEKLKNEALSKIPAPCCAEYSIATCCCPCNLPKSVWGLSSYLIVKKGYDVQHVKATVERWIRFTNEKGYAGNACHKGGCGRPFHEDGCGGMKEDQLSADFRP